MPPETKPVISKLEEMTCKNCIYYAQNNNNEFYFCTNPDSYDWDYEEYDHCSMGKWLTGRRYPSDFESELSVEDYDDTYCGIVRAQMFPDAVSIRDEYDHRHEILTEIEALLAKYGESNTDPARLLEIKDKLILLWGDNDQPL